MRKFWLICLIICFSILFGSAITVSADEVATVETDLSVSSGSNTVGAALPVMGSYALEGTSAVMLYELNTDTLLYTWNPDTRVYPSSLVKIMTAMLTIEKGTMNQVVTVKQSVLDTVDYDAISADLQAGEQISVKNLLYCMMTGSANDAAAVLADYIGNGEEAFVQLMNARAVELGCTGTNFINATGLHDDMQYSTPRDLMRILEKAMEYELFRQVFGAVTYTVPATNVSPERVLESSNNMLKEESYYYDSRISGGRTGKTNDGTRCFAASASLGDMQVISVVLGAESKVDEESKQELVIGGFNETKTLLDMIGDDYKVAQILYSGQALKQYEIAAGKDMITVGPSEALSVVLPQQASSTDLRYEYIDSGVSDQAEVQAGEKLSQVRIWYGEMCIGQADLYALHALQATPEPWVQTPEEDSPGPLKTVWNVVKIVLIIAAIAAVVIGLVIYFVVRGMRKRNANKRVRNYRAWRRRAR